MNEMDVQDVEYLWNSEIDQAKARRQSGEISSDEYLNELDRLREEHGHAYRKATRR